MYQLGENINQVECELQGKIPDWCVFYSLETGSTQALAKKSFKSGSNEKTIFLARNQTTGRGRKSRTWISSDNGRDITMSLLIPLSKPMGNVAMFSLVGGISVVSAIRELTGHDFKVKWPNDVYINDSKVGGIISELCITKDHSAIIMGIGLNVNSSKEEINLEESFYDVQTLSSECGHEIDLMVVINEIVKKLDSNIFLLEKNYTREILDQFLNMGWRIGQRIKFREYGKDWLEGVIHGLSDEGYMIMEDCSDGRKAILIEADICPVHKINL